MKELSLKALMAIDTDESNKEIQRRIAEAIKQGKGQYAFFDEEKTLKGRYVILEGMQLWNIADMTKV